MPLECNDFVPHAAWTECDSNATLCGKCGKALKEEKKVTSVPRELMKDATCWWRIWRTARCAEQGIVR